MCFRSAVLASFTLSTCSLCLDRGSLHGVHPVIPLHLSLCRTLGSRTTRLTLSHAGLAYLTRLLCRTLVAISRVSLCRRWPGFSRSHSVARWVPYLTRPLYRTLGSRISRVSLSMGSRISRVSLALGCVSHASHSVARWAGMALSGTRAGLPLSPSHMPVALLSPAHGSCWHQCLCATRLCSSARSLRIRELSSSSICVAASSSVSSSSSRRARLKALESSRGPRPALLPLAPASLLLLSVFTL